MVDGVRSSPSNLGYREFPTTFRMGWSGRAANFFNGGERLRTLQNDLFHGGYFPSQNYRREVDGLFGGRTQAAVRSLQQDLISAGVYQGPVDGVFDSNVAEAIARLKGLTQLPPGLDPA